MGPLQVALLWALLFLAEGDAQNFREILTQPGSELVLPITQQLTLHPPHCDRYQWGYGEIIAYDIIVWSNKRCELTHPNSERFPNMKTSENGSLIISPVTAENAGIYTVHLYNAAGKHIHRAIYTVHVEGDALNVRKILTQPGSELVLPITQQLTLRPPDCEQYLWIYGGIRGYDIIVRGRCELTQPNSERFPNMKTSENGSLIISPVTAENAGRYTVHLYNAAGKHIHTATYRLYVEAPVSPPVLDILCLPDGRAQVFCRVNNGSHCTTYLHVTGASEGSYSSPSNNIAVTVPTSGPWSVTCTAENRVSRRNITQSRAACPDSSSSLFAKLLPVRLFLVIILPVFLVCFEVYHHLQEKRSGDFSRGNGNRKPLPAFPRENTE